MSKGIARVLSVGFAKEATRGTAESDATFWVPFMESTVDDKDLRDIDEQSHGVIEESVDQKITKQWAEIQFKSLIGDKSFPLILFSTMGSLSSAVNADGSGNVYDHTLNVGQSAQHQSLTTFVNDPLSGQDYKHALSAVETMEISYEKNKFIQFALKMMAKKGTTATLTPTVANENKFIAKHVTFKLASAQSGLDAASAIVIKSLKLNINKNLESDDVLGSLAPADFLNRSFTIEGELEAMWQNESDFKTFTLAGTQKAMRIDLKNTDVTIGTAANPQIKIDLYKVSFNELSRPLKAGDLVMQTLQFKAHYSIADSKMVQIVCTNLQASY